jgi:uncharacterized phage infection (PIP) family protein YhgE
MKTILIPSFSKSKAAFAFPYTDEVLDKLAELVKESTRLLDQAKQKAASLSHITWHAPFHVVMVEQSDVSDAIMAARRVQILDTDFKAVFEPLIHEDNDGGAMLGVGAGIAGMFTLTSHCNGEVRQSVPFALPALKALL